MTVSRRNVLRVLGRSALATAAAPLVRPLAGPRGPGDRVTSVPEPAGMVRTSWSTDPWALGSYSYLPVGATPEARAVLRRPVADRVVLAGEATARTAPATVNGARGSGRRAARQILARARRAERVIVVGAGAAGITAARRLHSAGLSVTVVEARDRLGGRIDTVRPPGWRVPVERGASWVHDVDASDLAARLAAVGIATAPFAYDAAFVATGGRRAPSASKRVARVPAAIRRALRWADGRDGDVSLRDALAQSGAAAVVGVDARTLELWLRSEVVTEYGVEPEQLSAWWGLAEGTDGDDLLVVGGFERLIDEEARDLDVRLGHVVDRISWSEAGVRVDVRDRGPLAGDRVVVTVPLAVLASGAIELAPGLPAKHQAAIATLGTGVLDKVFLRFAKPFWPSGSEVWTVIDDGDGPFTEWYDLHSATGSPILMGLVGGATARAWATRSDREVRAAALASLRPLALAHR